MIRKLFAKIRNMVRCEMPVTARQLIMPDLDRFRVDDSKALIGRNILKSLKFDSYDQDKEVIVRLGMDKVYFKEFVGRFAADYDVPEKSTSKMLDGLRKDLASNNDVQILFTKGTNGDPTKKSSARVTYIRFASARVQDDKIHFAAAISKLKFTLTPKQQLKTEYLFLNFFPSTSTIYEHIEVDDKNLNCLYEYQKSLAKKAVKNEIDNAGTRG
eukprot:GEMP01040041.1.p1 GENE.GEMP01040041.1~~GEMP01040041.1.p1  ORF type:complete len:214 (+),score=14.94 GEMP01040041.1:114-755(+)